MQRKKSPLFRNEMIADAIALFVRNEAALLAQVAETNKAMAAAEKRFLRIEAELEQIKTVLRELTAEVARHSRILSDLPEMIRQKIGFKPRA
jgi:hypothetical protein